MQQINEFLAHSGCFGTPGIEKDPRCSIFQSQSRHFPAAHIESISVQTFSEQIEGHYHYDENIVQIYIIIPRLQEFAVYHSIIESRPLWQPMGLPFLDFCIIHIIKNILRTYIQSDLPAPYIFPEFLFHLRQPFQHDFSAQNDLEDVSEGSLVLHHLSEKKSVHQIQIL